MTDLIVGGLFVLLAVVSFGWLAWELRKAPVVADVFAEDFGRHADEACALTATAALWPDRLPDYSTGPPLNAYEKAVWESYEAELLRGRP